jgi:hypothetical protein
MKLLAKELFLEHQERRPVATGFITYVSSDRPVLMHCWGWEDYSDGYDDYCLSISEDNGRTWSAPELFLKSRPVKEGKVRYAEPVAFFDADTERVILVVYDMLYPDDRCDVDAYCRVSFDTYDAKTGRWAGLRRLDGLPEGPLAVSFARAIKTSRGRLLFPAMRQIRDESGRPMHHPGSSTTVDEPLTIIGEYDVGGELKWTLGEPVAVDPEASSRGLNESGLAELRDGRIARIMRGDNSMFPEKPGWKWLSFSSDDGFSWSHPAPLPFTGGEPLESGSSGCALFRSMSDGKLYWIGNLCLHGERPEGNYPRTTLVIAEMQEEPLALKRDTIFAIDERGYNDSPGTQLSNFRFYQDRETGDLVLFMVRYCVRGHEEWWNSDYYRYRVRMP